MGNGVIVVSFILLIIWAWLPVITGDPIWARDAQMGSFQLLNEQDASILGRPVPGDKAGYVQYCCPPAAVELVVKEFMCWDLYMHKRTLNNGSTSKEEEDLDPIRSFFGNCKIELKVMERRAEISEGSQWKVFFFPVRFACIHVHTQTHKHSRHTPVKNLPYVPLKK